MTDCNGGKSPEPRTNSDQSRLTGNHLMHLWQSQVRSCFCSIQAIKLIHPVALRLHSAMRPAMSALAHRVNRRNGRIRSDWIACLHVTIKRIC